MASSRWPVADHQAPIRGPSASGAVRIAMSTGGPSAVRLIRFDDVIDLACLPIVDVMICRSFSTTDSRAA